VLYFVVWNRVIFCRSRRGYLLEGMVDVTMKKQRPRGSSSLVSLHSLLSHGLVGIVCVYVGLMIGMSGNMSSPADSATMTDCSLSSSISTSSSMDRRNHRRQEISTKSSPESDSSNSTTQQRRQSPFPKSIEKMFVDYATVPRDDFNQMFDIGVPLDPPMEGAEEVVILYTSDKGLPWGKGFHHDKLGLDAETAVQNCHTVKVILQEPNRRRKTQQCFAFVPQWESYAIHKYMRLPKNVDSMAKNGKNAPELIDLKNPLRYVSRSYDDKGRHAGVPVVSRHTNPSYEVLVDYLQNLDRVLKELKPFLKDVMGKANAMSKGNGNRSKNTLVVLVCNKGQAPLFRNFVCNARAKNLDLSHLVMFATDQETLKMCQDLGIAAWYEDSIFGGLPETAARVYGDRTFTKMMLAKVYCVHLVLSCGYNVVFQDVDVIWYKNPLPFLDSEELEGTSLVLFYPFSPHSSFLVDIFSHVHDDCYFLQPCFYLHHQNLTWCIRMTALGRLGTNRTHQILDSTTYGTMQ
jgi:Nucleotide-diphospho-sugar transferase